MARETIVRLVDDLDGGAADETVSFALDGSLYEVDLSSAHAKQLRDGLAQFIEHARRGGKVTGSSGTKASKARRGTDRERSGDIRAWAKEQGIKVNERGRIPASVVERYEAAH